MTTNSLTKNLVYLSNHITNLPLILLHLKQEDVLSADESEEILKETTSLEKNNRLLTFLQKKDWPRVQSLFVNILSDTHNLHCVNVIQGTDTPTSTIWFDVQSPTLFYAGRDEEMEKINHFWLTGSKEGEVLFFVAITGIGGVGKTELAKNYGKKFYKDTQGHVIWINSETRQSRFLSFSKLATTKLGISLKHDSGDDKDLDEITVEVYKKLMKDRNSNIYLIIFDNVGHEDEDNFLELLIETFRDLPPTERKPFVLFTSRYTPIKEPLGDLCEQLYVDMLPINDAQCLLMNALKVNESDLCAQLLIASICSRLGNFPLALQQAIAFIKKFPLVQPAMKKYLEMIDKETKKGLDQCRPRLQQYGKTSETTYTTWKVTLETIENDLDLGILAKNVMNIISFCSSDNIRTEFVSKLAETQNDEVFYLLNDYSMIKLTYTEDNGQELSVHRLVQDVTQIYMQENKELLSTLESLINLVTKFLKNDEERASITVGDLTNLGTIWKHAAKKPVLVKKHANVPVLLLLAYDITGHYRMGYDFCIDAIQILEKEVGEEDPWTMKTVHWKGVMLEHLGRRQESLEVLKNVYERQKKSLGEDHDDSLWTAGQIGNAYWRQDHFDDAKLWIKEAVKNRETRFGTNHEGTLGLKNCLGLVLNDEGKYEEAEELFRQMLESWDSVQRREHYLTLSLKHNLGSALHGQGKNKEAMAVWHQVLEVRLRALGKDHPKTLITKFRLADAFESEGRNGDALDMFQQVLEGRERALGTEHPLTVKTKERIELLSGISSSSS